jgi:hypothetical protein
MITRDVVAMKMAVDIIERFANAGALKHNQLYDNIHNMESGKIETVMTDIAKAMTLEVYSIIRSNLEENNAIFE